jgi:hypothetical protein
MKVFISHSSTDKWVARQIARQIEELGVESFLDEKDIETGDSIDKAIQSNLADCDELLMLLSPASLKSSWVLIEIGGAKALDKRLVPILLHVGPNELPDVLSDGLARDINEIERYYDEVGERAKALAAEQPAEPAGVFEVDERDGRRAARAARSFAEGDLVRLPRQAPESTYARNGYDIGWNPDMERYLGLETRVLRANDSQGAVEIEADNGAWLWLMDWLDPVG